LINSQETLSTLRYADRAKQIKNKAIVNEDPNEKLIRGLREELELMRKQLEESKAAGGGGGGGGTGMVEKEKEELRKKLEAEKEAEVLKLKEQMEAIEQEQAKSWKQRLEEAEERAATLATLAGGGSHVKYSPEELKDKKEKVPYLINLNEDDALTGKIIHFLEDGDTSFGRKDSDVAQTVCLGGLSIQKEHCVIANDVAEEEISMIVMAGAKVSVNGKPVVGDVDLNAFDRITIGHNHVFVLCLAGTTLEEAVDSEGNEIDFNYGTSITWSEHQRIFVPWIDHVKA